MLDIIAKLESASNSADRMGDVDVVRTAFVKELISDLRAENEELKRLDRERLAKLDQIKNGIETLKADKKALAEACDLFVKHSAGYNIDGTPRQIKDDTGCGRNWNKVLGIAKSAIEQHGK